MRRLFLLALLVFVLVAGWFLVSLYQPFTGDGGARKTVTLKPGGVGDLASALEDEGIISSSFFFQLRTTLEGKRGSLKPGTYTLREDMSYSDVIAALEKGPPANTIQVSVPEGRSRSEIAESVSESGLKGDYEKATRRSRDLNPRRYGAKGAKDLEGFLWPSTYELKRGQNVRLLIDKQLRAFKDNFATVSMRAARSKNLTPYEVLTIASLVERETAVPRERKLIASVIYNRLAQDQSLGIDATVRFFTGNWDKPLTQSELQTPNPLQHAGQQGTAAGADRQPGPALDPRGGQPARHRLPVLRRRPVRPEGPAPHVPQDAGRVQRGGRPLQPGARGGRRQGPQGVLAGVLGYPVAHSRSPAMHNAAFEALGMAPGWRYVALPISGELFEETVRALPGSGYRGANVTIPHKLLALAVADEASDSARGAGAANTLTFEDGAIRADNTDVGGLLDAIGEPPATALVLGAGGAARGAVWALREAGAEVAVWNRTVERADALAGELGVSVAAERRAAWVRRARQHDRGRPGREPLRRERADGPRAGRKGTAPAGGRPGLPGGGAQTPLERWAGQARFVDGLEILVRQGARSFEIWTGRKPPLDAMRAAARA